MATAPPPADQATAAARLARIFAGAGTSQGDAQAAADHYVAEAARMISTGDFTAPAGTAPVAGAFNPSAHPRAPAGSPAGGQFAPATGGGAGTARPTPTNQQPVGPGARGEQVRQLQQRLKALGYNIDTDGIFGPQTRAAVRQYQASHLDANGKPLKVDGLVGPLTTGALRAKTQRTTGTASTTKTRTGTTSPRTAKTRKKPAPGSTAKNTATKTAIRNATTSAPKKAKPTGVKPADTPGSVTKTQKSAVGEELKIRAIPAKTAAEYAGDLNGLSQNDASALLTYIRNTYGFKAASGAQAAGRFRNDLHPRDPDGKFTSLDSRGGRHAGPGSFAHIRSIENLASEIDTGDQAGGAGQSETAAALRNVARHVGLRQTDAAKRHMGIALEAARREGVSGTQLRDLNGIAASLEKIPAGTYPEPGFGERTRGRPAPPSLQRHRRGGPGYFPDRTRRAASPPADPATAAAAAIADLGLTADAAALAAEIAAWNDVAHGQVTAAESAGWQHNKGNSSHLHDYWAHGEGAAKIRWGTEGDWYRCRDLLRKYIANPEGYCEKMHQEVTGMTTSQHAQEDRGGKKAAADTPALPALVTLPGVDILAAGTWNLSTGRQTFTAADLQSAIDASACPAVGLPVIKIGHLDPRFATPPEHDGEPALGRVHNLRLSGNGAKIIGDLAGMPGWLGAIAASAFPRRSVEGKYGFKCQIGHDHPFVLTGLALLGVTQPGVGVLGGLPDIATLYGLTAATAQAGQAWRTEQDQEGNVMAVTEEDVRRQYYATAGAPQSWWITELQMHPPQLIVADEQSGKIYRVGYQIDGSAVTFEQAAEVASYADVAATRGTGPVVAFASAAESRAVTAAGTWDGAAAVRNLGDSPSGEQLKGLFALPGENKSASSLPHHDVGADGKVGPPNPAACSAAIAALNGGRGGLTGVSASQKQTAYNHLAAHLKSMGRTPPDFSGAATSWDGEPEAQVEWGLGWLAAAYGRGDPPDAAFSGTEPGTLQEPGSFAARVGRLIDIRAQAEDADADDTVQALVASLDATLDQASELASQVDPKTVSEAAGQVLALVTAAEAIADQLMDKLGIYDPDDAGEGTAAAAAGTGPSGDDHGAFDGEHDHPHPAFGSQGDDATHSHPHRHSGDRKHDHQHDTQAAATTAAASQEGGDSGMGYEFTTQQMAAIRARLGKQDGEEITATDIAAVFGAPAPPWPVQAAAAGTAGTGPVEVPVIADGVHLVEANILRKYQEEALAGRRAVRAMHVKERDGILAAAIKEGKFAQGRLDHFKQLWDRDPDGTRKLVASLAGGLVPMDPMGSNGDWATDPDMAGDFDAQRAYKDLYPEDVQGGVSHAPGVRGGAFSG